MQIFIHDTSEIPPKWIHKTQTNHHKLKQTLTPWSIKMRDKDETKTHLDLSQEIRWGTFFVLSCASCMDDDGDGDVVNIKKPLSMHIVSNVNGAKPLISWLNRNESIVCFLLHPTHCIPLVPLPMLLLLPPLSLFYYNCILLHLSFWLSVWAKNGITICHHIDCMSATAQARQILTETNAHMALEIQFKTNEKPLSNWNRNGTYFGGVVWDRPRTIP